ncbi:leucyl aminopeptidase [Acetobacter sp. AN02]|uniref:leucyl aminopeptidase n=1 Tax=Acetobacter sp. AN02 TaxID=2894186 RepID=UPI00243459C5|nr:leucyl aminopeptidase [Acetobacter sp. AN02]MDG6095525.1 leucyl aminopeptidase [Acetobacter sp. AN02]
MVDLSFQAADAAAGGTLALLEKEDGERSALFREADSLTGGALSRAAEAASFTFAHGKTCVVLAPGGKFTAVVLAGLGKGQDLTSARAESAGGAAALQLTTYEKPALAVDGLPETLAVHAVLGAQLALYDFDLYRTVSKDRKRKITGLEIVSARTDALRQDWADWEPVLRGVTLARDLVSEPANVLSPVVFAERASGLAALGLEIEVLDQPAMEKLGFGALLGVAQGSANAPRTVIMRWNGAKDGSAPVAFVGKGVTFDSGGISIKPAAGMEDMKWDMGGAGVVTGLMAALAGRKAKVNAVGIIGLVENMVSGTAQRPGDVVKSASGQTIEVLNTDAEGRLVLADLLWYVREHCKPRAIIDLATLTGAIIVALGHERAGLFASDDGLAKDLEKAGEESGELLWRMPLGDAYDQHIRSDIADMKNIGNGRAGGSITAAQFLKRFTGETPWAHLDIAGTTWASKAGTGTVKGATGFGVRLLDRLVRQSCEG